MGPATEETKHRRQNQDFLFGERAWAEYTHAQLTSFIKGIGIIFLWDLYSQPFTMVFCKWNFETFQMRHWFPPCFKGDDTNICTMTYGMFLTSDEFHQTEHLCITEAFKIGYSKRSSSLEETMFSSLCYNKEYRWNIIYTFFCTLSRKLAKSNTTLLFIKIVGNKIFN